MKIITKLKIKNFKSIKILDLSCSRVNVFIGKPNTGKTNILEALALSSISYTKNLRDFVRFKNLSNLFYDSNIKSKIVIKNNLFRYSNSLELEYISDLFHLKYGQIPKQLLCHFVLDFGGISIGEPKVDSSYRWPIRFYKFIQDITYKDSSFAYLKPPFGENLLQMISTYKNIAKQVKILFEDYGLGLSIDEVKKELNIYKEGEYLIKTLPYSVTADTLQRFIFHMAAIETNEDSVLIFDEPESFAFPFYVSHLAETIAKYSSNQYFIATHNPYFLLSIIEKTQLKDLRIFVTFYKDFQTKIVSLNREQLSEVLDMGQSVFYNLEYFIEGEE